MARLPNHQKRRQIVPAMLAAEGAVATVYVGTWTTVPTTSEGERRLQLCMPGTTVANETACGGHWT